MSPMIRSAVASHTIYNVPVIDIQKIEHCTRKNRGQFPETEKANILK